MVEKAPGKENIALDIREQIKEQVFLLEISFPGAVIHVTENEDGRIFDLLKFPVDIAADVCGFCSQFDPSLDGCPNEVVFSSATCFPVAFASPDELAFEVHTDKFDALAVLFENNYPFLSAIVFMAIVGIPAVLLLGIIYVSVAIRESAPLPGARRALRWVLMLAPWSMAEIFLIGILVSFVKIVSLADVALGISFWAYVLFTVCSLLALLYIDRREVWRQLDTARRG